MNRRYFLQTIAAATAAIPSLSIDGMNLPEDREDSHPELTRHKIKTVKYTQIQLRYPRLVGKNSRLDVHGTGPNVTICTLTTDRGAEGIGMLRGNTENADKVFAAIKDKSVWELFQPSQGTLDERHLIFDFCLYDLAGVILNKPVYALMGAEKPVVTRCYSGMIYFDEMEPENNPAGLDKVLENCRYDYEYGYRQFKVKIGRGGKWMSKEEGLKTDIAVTGMIFENFPDCDILVDGNDAFTVDYFISYLEGIKDVPLFWIEEPFRETRENYAGLRKWLTDNGRRNTLLADGEANPDLELALELGREKLLDVYIDDIAGYGMTRWRKLAPRLQEIGMMMSPHAWGSALKSFYITHLTGAYGNTPTIEGVTCFSDDIDLSAYRLVKGRITPPSAPGFGMKLLK
ncbi:MAG: hypothetical protein LBE91_08715 [Tannerella sp.]|jgi:L-alanine-DL-glutamate epimerase-like enolase superfamily enzyme|nr:hypothetical protein [Tannerella sp.]